MRYAGLQQTVLTALLVTVATLSQAAPVQTFAGLVAIGDDINSASNLVGLNFSIDGDGIFDLNLAYGGIAINSFFGWNAAAREASSGSAAVFTDGTRQAMLFAANEMIGPGATTVASAQLGSADVFGGSSGAFAPSPDPLSGSQRGFIGFSFLIGGATHYGWADVEVDLQGDFGDGFLNLYGYGYETTADTAIAAGAGAVPLPAAIWLLLPAVASIGWRTRKPG